jgi:plastocyanin
MRVLESSYLFVGMIATVLSGCQQPVATPPRVAAAVDSGTPSPAAAAAPVPTGEGSVAGTVRLTGTFTPTPPHPVASGMQKVCGESVPDLSLSVRDEKLAGAVISIDDLPAAPLPANAQVDLDQLHCAYRPAIAAGRAGGTLNVKNSDALLHNVRAQAGGGTMFNLMMPIENTTLTQKLPAPGVVDLHCDVHPWMRAWVAVFANDAYAVTGEDGRYTIVNLPAGRHKVRAWHPRLGTQQLTVDVPQKGAATVDVVWDSASISP